ncbi:MAG: hypothetical protein AB1Z98_31915 [Nannocystaceae bacterium]
MKTTLVLASIAVALASTACAIKVKKAGAQNLNCPASEVTLTRAKDIDSPGTVQGCGREDSVLVHCISAKGSAGSASSCKTLWFSEATEQASFTTGCPKDEIETTWMKPNLGVDACGQRMTFTPSLSGWILNSTSEPSEG